MLVDGGGKRKTTGPGARKKGERDAQQKKNRAPPSIEDRGKGYWLDPNQTKREMRKETVGMDIR